MGLIRGAGLGSAIACHLGDRRRLPSRAFALLVSACISSHTALAQEAQQFSVGSWRGLAAPAADNAPGGCAAISEFSNGDRVAFLLTTNLSMGVQLSRSGERPGWLPADATGPVRAWVDDELQFAFSGVARPDSVLLEVGSIQGRAGASAFRRLGEGSALNVAVGAATQRYALRGAYAALAELVGCALKVRAGEVAFPPRPAPPVASAPPPAASAPVAQRPAPPEPHLSGSGSGVVVSDAGHVLTADHVIAGCRGVRAAQVGNAPVDVAVVGRDQRNDLALLRASTPFEHVATLRMDAIRNGESVVAFGFPLGGILASTGNVTFGNVSALVGLGDDSRMLQISAPVQPGNSGGPLFDAGGLLIGVVQSKLNAINVAQVSGDIPQNVNFAMKGSVAVGFLEAHDVEPHLERRGSDLSQADVTAQAQRVTVRVLCFE